MAKRTRTNNDQQSITHKTKDLVYLYDIVDVS